jgi:hypothetical protein
MLVFGPRPTKELLHAELLHKGYFQLEISYFLSTNILSVKESHISLRHFVYTVHFVSYSQMSLVRIKKST